MGEKQETFEFVDRRRVRADSPPEETLSAEEVVQPEAPSESPGQQESTSVEPEADAREDASQAGIPDVDVYDLLASFVGMLTGLAWQKMGIMASPATGKVEMDMEQARVVIDTLQFMAGKLEVKLPDSDARELRRLMMDLQVNFLRRNSSGP